MAVKSLVHFRRGVTMPLETLNTIPRILQSPVAFDRSAMLFAPSWFNVSHLFTTLTLNRA